MVDPHMALDNQPVLKPSNLRSTNLFVADGSNVSGLRLMSTAVSNIQFRNHGSEAGMSP